MECNTCDFCYKKTKILYKLPQIDKNKICGYCMTCNLKKIWVDKNEAKEARRVPQGVMV
jgi:NMD protein affecting ribosome stability and mRNA decay